MTLLARLERELAELEDRQWAEEFARAEAEYLALTVPAGELERLFTRAA